MGECEEGEGDPEIEEEMVVERGTVGAGVDGEKPGCDQERAGGVQEARLAGEEHELRISCLRVCDPTGINRTSR